MAVSGFQLTRIGAALSGVAKVLSISAKIEDAGVILTSPMVFVAFGNNTIIIEHDNTESIVQIGSNATIASAR